MCEKESEEPKYYTCSTCGASYPVGVGHFCPGPRDYNQRYYQYIIKK